MTDDITDDDQNRNATDDDEEELELTHIIQTAEGWGSGSHEYDALQKMLEYNGDFEGDVKVAHHRVRGDWGLSMMFDIRAEEIVGSTVYEMSARELNRLADLLEDIELDIEALFVESPVVEDAEDEEADDE